MKKYLDANLRFPGSANQKFKKQKAPVRLIVAENGTIDSVLILKARTKLVDTEAVRAINGMPFFVPSSTSLRPGDVPF